jgi:hypothetical protein
LPFFLKKLSKNFAHHEVLSSAPFLGLAKMDLTGLIKLLLLHYAILVLSNHETKIFAQLKTALANSL